jgi:ribose-phosphate pyrophosphokinase
VVADTIVAAGAAQLVVVDPHTPAVEAIFGIPVETVSAARALATAIAVAGSERGVVVAPDLGAVKLARRFAEHLGLPVAVVQKRRLTGDAVRVDDVAGEVDGRSPIVVDDMITTGGTIEGAVNAVLARGSTRDVLVAATHGLFVGAAADRLARLPIRRLLVTDTVADGGVMEVPLAVHTIADELAHAVRRLYATSVTNNAG